MIFVCVLPTAVTSAAQDLDLLGCSITSARTRAAAATTDIASAAADEVSTAIAGLFSAHAQDFQKLAGQATAFHEQFTQQLAASAAAYSNAEAANAGLLSNAADSGTTNPRFYWVPPETKWAYTFVADPTLNAVLNLLVTAALFVLLAPVLLATALKQ